MWGERSLQKNLYIHEKTKNNVRAPCVQKGIPNALCLCECVTNREGGLKPQYYFTS